MLNILLAQQVNDLIPAGLPAAVPVAHKTGSLDGLRHDAGIVYGPSGPYIFVCMSSSLPDDSVAEQVVPALSAAIYHYFNDRPSQPARYFPETGQFLASPFLRFWNTYDGAETLGPPIGPEQVVAGYRTQWFTRARLGLPPGPETPDQIQVGNLGLEALGPRRFDPVPDPGDPLQSWFAATGQVLRGPFLDYWTAHGGIRLFGNPISPVLNEDVPGAGVVPVQYFEHGRLELRGDTVQVSALGSRLFNH